jgi:hypothetical protein
MASIVGDLTEIEASGQRESLEKRLDRERAHCVHLARSIAASRAESL